MKTRLPLFPLPIVVLPGEFVQLHIFEERYKAMLAACRAGDATGQPLPFAITLGAGDTIAAVACTVRLERVTHEYDDGRLDIIVAGDQRVRIARVLQEHGFLEALVEPFSDGRDDVSAELRERALALATKLLEMRTGSPVFISAEGSAHLSFRLALTVGLEPPEKQQLLQGRSERVRLALVAQVAAGLIAGHIAADQARPQTVN